MNIRKILFLTCCNISLCFGGETFGKIKSYFAAKHPVEKMYEKLVHDIPNLTKLIKKKKYASITFERLYKIKYTLDALLIFIIHIKDSHLHKKLINELTTQKNALNFSLLNTLYDILNKPIELKTEKDKHDIIIELLDLAVGPEPTLLDILQTVSEEFVNTLSSFYTKLIESMYKTYINIQNEPKKLENKTYLEQSLHYAQQAYKTMKQYNLLLTFNDNTNQLALIDWLTQKEPSYTQELTKTIAQKIEKKLKIGMQKLKQKTHSSNKKTSFYLEFINDIDFHAELVTILFEALSVHRTTGHLPWTNTLQTYIKSISDYLKSLPDSKLVDLLPEAPLFRHYKDFLTKYIKQMLKSYESFEKNFYVANTQIPYMSTEQINKIHQFTDQWINKYILFTNEHNDRLVRYLSPTTARSLLFYSEIIEHAYKPERYQWNPLNKEIKKDLIKNNDNIFAFWQKEIVTIYAKYLFELSTQNKLSQNIDPYFFTYTKKPLFEHIKQHAPEQLDVFETEYINQDYLPLLSEYGFIKQQQEIPTFFLTLNDKKQIENMLLSIKKVNNKAALLKLNLTFARFINQKHTLDIIQGRGITGTLHVLDALTEFLFSMPHFTSINQDISKTPIFTQLKRELEQLLNNMHDLQNTLFVYLTSVLYAQTPTPLYQAYIKTGQLLITAIQKVIDLAYKKWAILKLKSFQKNNFNFKQLDTEYEKKKLYI